MKNHHHHYLQDAGGNKYYPPRSMWLKLWLVCLIGFALGYAANKTCPSTATIQEIDAAYGAGFAQGRAVKCQSR